jgi:hypothetical protein
LYPLVTLFLHDYLVNGLEQKLMDHFCISHSIWLPINIPVSCFNPSGQTRLA